MTHRFSFAFCLAPGFAVLAAAPGPAAAQGYTGYPYSIMTREPGSAKRHQGITAVPPQDVRTPHEPAASATARYPRRALVARGSSGSVLPTPFRGRSSFRRKAAAPRRRVRCRRNSCPTVVPGLARPIPNLSHGPETFQDRARVAPSSKASMACQGPQAFATWAPACSERHSGAPRSGEPRYHRHSGRGTWIGDGAVGVQSRGLYGSDASAGDRHFTADWR